jgi:hypothetical protein
MTEVSAMVDMALTYPPAEVSRRISRLIAHRGIPIVARAIGMSPSTVSKLANGSLVTEGSIALVEKRFRAVDDE